MENWDMSLGHRKVIIRSNEKTPFKIGKLLGFHQVDRHGTEVPLVRVDDQDLICLGAVIPWSPEMEHFLNSLTPERQWVILREIFVAVKMIRTQQEFPNAEA
jgi:hypothetical protein